MEQNPSSGVIYLHILAGILVGSVMYQSKANDICPAYYHSKRKVAFFAPFTAAFLYGALVVQVTVIITYLLMRISVWDSLFLIGSGLSLFAALTLWPLLVQFGKGKTIAELRMQLNQSHAAIRSLKSSEAKLNSDLKGYQVELTRSHRHFRHVLKTFNMATFYCDLNHRFEWAHNFSFKSKDIIGKSVAEVISADTGKAVAQLMQNAIDDGQIHEGEFQIPVGDEMRSYVLQIAPRYNRDGAIIGSLCVSNDITEKAKWHQHLASMTLEVNHRARNLLAIVVALLGQLEKTATSNSQYKSALLTRVMSLAKSIDLITQDSWTASSLKKLIDSQIALVEPEYNERIKFDSADIRLKSKAIQNIGLAIHELATFSKSIGAFASDDGCVTVSWSIDQEKPDPSLTLTWQEQCPDGNAKQLPEGFGVKILKRIAAQDLGGDSKLSYEPTGLQFQMVLPGKWLEMQDSANAKLVSESVGS